MPPFFLILFLLITSTVLVQVFLLTPLEFLRSLILPRWLILAVLVLLISWCFEE